jgi:16S rRNA (uracil1498-N3)-methyltransferase
VELGIDAFLPLRMRHCVVKISGDKAAKKTNRYQTIAKEASEQCKRTSIPRVARPTDLRSLDYEDYDEVLVPFERTHHDESLKKHLRRTGTDLKRLVIIGPEGGFAPDEVDFLTSKNAVFVSLGRTVLRAETAAVYTIGGIRYEHE